MTRHFWRWIFTIQFSPLLHGPDDKAQPSCHLLHTYRQTYPYKEYVLLESTRGCTSHLFLGTYGSLGFGLAANVPPPKQMYTLLLTFCSLSLLWTKEKPRKHHLQQEQQEAGAANEDIIHDTSYSMVANTGKESNAGFVLDLLFSLFFCRTFLFGTPNTSNRQ